MDQKTEGVLHPEELCTKPEEKMMEVLRTKHLDARPPSAASLDMYLDRPQKLVPVEITK